jgi:RNA polymerase sigma factor (sigma-70 family)
VLLSSYTESPATWRSFAAIKSANDFKDHTGTRPSQTGDLEEVAPGGEIKHGSVKESTYQFSVDTFGKMLTVDRRDIVNDDLGLFEDTANSLGRAAMRSLSDLVYKVLLANAGGFFGAGNGNYDEGAGTALSSTSLGTGVARIMAQRNKVRRIGWLSDLNSAEKAELQQECLIDVARRWQYYDPRQCPEMAFVAMVVKNRIMDFYANRLKVVRDFDEKLFSLDDPAKDEDGDKVESGHLLPESAHEFRRNTRRRSRRETFELQHDIRHLVAKLPPDLQRVCEMLMRYSVAEAARRLKMPQSTLRDKIKGLKDHFKDVQDYLNV